jgi:predicted RNA binding protein YcfA (HicA-like mRNA interferase family)
VPLAKVTARRLLIQKFRNLGFDGPHAGSKHYFMRKGTLTVTIPNKHKGDEIGRPLLKEILRQAGISERDWMNA